MKNEKQYWLAQKENHFTQTDGGLLLHITEDAQYLQSLGPGYRFYAEKLEALQSRLSEGKFHLAALGQFKRGKSTLLNALLGDQILPSSVIPLTAVPILIQYGEKKEARIRYLEKREDTVFQSEDTVMMRKFVETYVSEEINPHNKLPKSKTVNSTKSGFPAQFTEFKIRKWRCSFFLQEK